MAKEKTLSVRVEEEIGDTYQEICGDEEVDMSEPLRGFVESLVDDPGFRDFYFEHWRDAGSFEDTVADYSGSIAGRENVQKGLARLEAGLENSYRGLAYEGAELLEEADDELGAGIRRALDGMDENYWEI